MNKITFSLSLQRHFQSVKISSCGRTLSVFFLEICDFVSYLNLRHESQQALKRNRIMTELNIGDSAPGFTLPVSGGNTVCLGDFAGKNLVIYFYPKDDTPGCTKEAIGFTELKAEFDAANTAILGISKDTVAKHDKFIAKHDLGIALGSDENGDMINAYGVWVEKKMYGKTYMGIERSTFLIDPDGKIANVWRKVRVKGHVEAVLDAAKTLNA